MPSRSEMRANTCPPSISLHTYTRTLHSNNARMFHMHSNNARMLLSHNAAVLQLSHRSQRTSTMSACRDSP